MQKTSIEFPTDRPLSDQEIALAVADAILNDGMNPNQDNAFQPTDTEAFYSRLGIPQDGTGRTGVVSNVRQRVREENPDLGFRLAEFCWRLVGLGFLVPWGAGFCPSKRGREYLATLDPNALTPGGLDAKLAQLGFDASDPVRQYGRLAQDCFLAGHYESAVLMLGVASEALINELADRLSGMPSSVIPSLKKRPQRPTAVQNLAWVTEALTSHARDFGRLLTSAGKDADWIEPLKNVLHGTGQAIRLTRNEAGHPTRIVVDQGQALELLQLFPRYAQFCATAFKVL